LGESLVSEEVEVVHLANDPVNMRGYAYEKEKEGKEKAKVGSH